MFSERESFSEQPVGDAHSQVEGTCDDTPSEEGAGDGGAEIEPFVVSGPCHNSAVRSI